MYLLLYTKNQLAFDLPNVFPFISVENIIGTHSKFRMIIEVEKDNKKDPFTKILDIQAPLWDQNDPYPLWAIIFAKCINIIATFTFNYTGIFVTMIGIGLSTLFKLYNAEMKCAKSEV